LEENRDGDPANGKWEFPGGRLEDGETPFDAAKREWQEETGVNLPDGEQVGSWVSPNGVYEGYIYLVPDEDAINIRKKPKIENPDTPAENASLAWFPPHEVPDMPGLRAECRNLPWGMIGSANHLASES
jgi:8-oxo-dGTP pyrophosphatase MutT (NUDIX family)